MATVIEPERFRSRAAAHQGTSGNGGGTVDDTQQRLGALESSMTELRADVSAIKATLPHLATKAEVAQLRAELHTEVGGLRAELKEAVGALRAELREAIGSLRAELKGDIGALRAEMHAGQTRMIKWFIGTAITLVVAVFSIARYLQ